MSNQQELEPNGGDEPGTDSVEPVTTPTTGETYSGPDPEADPKGDESDEDQGT